MHTIVNLSRLSTHEPLTFIHNCHHTAANLDVEHQHEVGQVGVLNACASPLVGCELLGRTVQRHSPFSEKALLELQTRDVGVYVVSDRVFIHGRDRNMQTIR